MNVKCERFHKGHFMHVYREKHCSAAQEQRGLANSVTYGCMLDACVKCGNLQKAAKWP